MTFKRRVGTGVLAMLLIGSIVLAGLFTSWDQRTVAQTEPTSTAASEAPPTPTPPFSVSLLAEAEVGQVPAGDLGLSVVSIMLPPLSVTEPFTNPGPVVIRVDKGTITLEAAEATIGPVIPSVGIIQPEPPAPGPADGVIVGAGQQIVLAAGTTARVRNDGDVPATILVIALQTEEGASSPDATPGAIGTATRSPLPVEATPSG